MGFFLASIHVGNPTVYSCMRLVLLRCTEFMMGKRKALMEPVTDVIAEVREHFGIGANAACIKEGEEEEEEEEHC